jgi:hypothetical protein
MDFKAARAMPHIVNVREIWQGMMVMIHEGLIKLCLY